MATIVAAAGGGNWTSGATWVGGVAPTAADDAQLTSASGSVTIDSGAVCRSLDCNTYTATLTHNASVTLVIGDATAGSGALALRLVAGMTYTLVSSTTSAIRFASTSTTLQAVTFGTRVPGNISFNGAGGKWQLQDGLNAPAITVTLVTGTLDTNNQTLSLSVFSATGGATRTMTFGSSSITCSFAGIAFLGGTSGAAVTITTNTAIVTCTSAGANFTSGSLNWHGLSVVYTGGGTATLSTTNSTFANITYTGTAATTNALRFAPGNTTTITGTLSVQSNSSTSRVLVQSVTNGSTSTVIAGAVAFNYVDFTDIAASGAAIPWTGTVLGDAVGNSNITFVSPVTRYAVAAGNWSSTATWSTTSGGAGGASVPLCHDTVILDASSGAGTYTLDQPRAGKDITCTGFTRTLTYALAQATDVYGSLTLASGMTFATNSGVTRFSGRGSHTLITAGRSFGNSITFQPVSGTYTLGDALTANANVTASSGTFNTGNNTIWVGLVLVLNTGTTVDLGTTTVTLGAVGAGFTNNSATFSGANSTISYTVASSSGRTFTGGDKTYGTLNYTVAGSTGSLTITGANTFGTINFSDATNARTLTLPASTTTTITNSFNVRGTAGKLMSITSSTDGTGATLSKAGAQVSCDYVSIKDSVATGGANFIAYASTDVSGNSGWTFGTLRTISASGGNWNATAAWVEGVVPTASDRVVATASSGAVNVNVASVCLDLDLTSYVSTLTLTANVSISGYLKFVSGMTLTQAGGAVVLVATTTNGAVGWPITTAGKSLPNTSFTGATGSWTLQDTFTSTGILNFTAGTLNTNSQTVNVNIFLSSNSNVRTLTLGATVMTCSGSSSTSYNTSTAVSLTYTANTAVVTLTGATSTLHLGNTNSNGTSYIMTGAGTCTLSGNGSTVKSLSRIGTAVKTDSLVSTASITCTSTLTLTGNSVTNRLLVRATTAGTAITFTAATAVLTNVDCMDITAAGAAAPFSGTSLGNALGNSQITFDTPVTQTHTTAAGGNWSSAAVWTSRVPLPQDNVVIDANTTGTITADMPRLGANITFTGFAGTAAFSSVANSMFGSLTVAAGMTLTGTQVLTLGGRSALALTSAGKQFPQAVTVSAPNATYTLADALSTAGDLSVLAGTLATASYAVSCLTLQISGALATLSPAASIVSLTSTAAATILSLASSGAITAGSTAEFVVANASTLTRTVSSTNSATRYIPVLTYTLAGSTGILAIVGGATIGTLNFSDASNARTLQLPSTATVAITNTFNVHGTAGKLMAITASTPGSAAILSKPTGVVSAVYLSIQDSTATGGASWYAGLNSTNVSGNSGWIFGVPPVTVANFFELFD